MVAASIFLLFQKKLKIRFACTFSLLRDINRGPLLYKYFGLLRANLADRHFTFEQLAFCFSPSCQSELVFSEENRRTASFLSLAKTSWTFWIYTQRGLLCLLTLLLFPQATLSTQYNDSQRINPLLNQVICLFDNNSLFWTILLWFKCLKFEIRKISKKTCVNSRTTKSSNLLKATKNPFSFHIKIMLD